MTDSLHESTGTGPCDDPFCTVCETTRLVEAERTRELRERLRRRKALVLGEQDIHELVHLPKDVVVRGYSYDWQREAVIVHLVSDKFSVVPDGVEAPVVDKTIEYVECDQGLLHVKWHIHNDEETE